MTTHAHAKTKKKRASVAASSGTMRDTFAAAALPVLCHSSIDDEAAALAVAKRAYMVADAMLEARDEEPDTPPEEPPAE